jgi:hypothetical protein
MRKSVIKLNIANAEMRAYDPKGTWDLKMYRMILKRGKIIFYFICTGRFWGYFKGLF